MHKENFLITFIQVVKEPLLYSSRVIRKIDNAVTINLLRFIYKKYVTRKTHDSHESNSIVFILENIGDTITGLPAFNYFKDKNTVVVCSKYNHDILELSGIKSIIILNRDPGLFDVLRLLFNLRNSSFKYSFVLDYTKIGYFGVLVSRLLKVEQIVAGFNNAPADIYTDKIVYNEPNVDVLTLAKASIISPVIRLNKIEKKIKLENTGEFKHFQGYIGFHIGGFGSIMYPVSRQYPLAYAYEIIKELLLRGHRVVVTGDKRDRRDFRNFSDKLSCYSGFNDLAGKLTLKELACLLQEITLYATSDNGTLHLAQAVGCRKIYALLGPSSPELVRGINTEIIRLDIPCSPCLTFLKFTERCDNSYNHQCLKDLKPGIVLERMSPPN